MRWPVSKANSFAGFGVLSGYQIKCGIYDHSKRAGTDKSEPDCWRFGGGTPHLFLLDGSPELQALEHLGRHEQCV